MGASWGFLEASWGLLGASSGGRLEFSAPFGAVMAGVMAGQGAPVIDAIHATRRGREALEDFRQHLAFYYASTCQRHGGGLQLIAQQMFWNS